MGVVEIFWAEGGRDISVDAGGDGCQWVSLQRGAGGDRVCDGGNVVCEGRAKIGTERSEVGGRGGQCPPYGRGTSNVQRSTSNIQRNLLPELCVLCFHWGVAGGEACVFFVSGFAGDEERIPAGENFGVFCSLIGGSGGRAAVFY